MKEAENHSGVEGCRSNPLNRVPMTVLLLPNWPLLSSPQVYKSIVP